MTGKSGGSGVGGEVQPGYEKVAEILSSFVSQDASYSGSLCVHQGPERVVDLWWGPAIGAESLLPIFSSSKGMAGLVVACLVRDSLLDLDRRVADYWPEFAAKGKSAVTVRQLLSHQAGLLGVDGGFTYADLYGHDDLAARLAAQRPYWAPGAAYAYHGITIGVLADELVRRTAGVPLGAYLRDNIAGPRALDVYLGTPEELDPRVVEVTLPTAEEMAALAEAATGPIRGSLASLGIPRDHPPAWVECNEARWRRAGTPAAGGLASARGLAGLYASITHESAGVARLLDDDTLEQMAQLQVAGYELTQTVVRSAFAVIFQKPTEHHPFGSYRAFGHDGLGGSLAFFDPYDDVAFGYIVQRIPLPGGADQRAIELSRAVHASARGRRARQ